MTTIDTEPEVIGQAFAGNVVIREDAGGRPWAGTVYWLVKATKPRKDPGGIDAILTAPRAVRLEEHEIHTLPALVRWGERMLRIYERPDGETVALDDAYVSTVLAMVADWDEDGERVPIPTDMRQGDSPLSPVGVYAPDDELLAVLMPVRHQ